MILSIPIRFAAIAMFLLAGAVHTKPVSAAELGRLFFDPQQRAELDRRRAQPQRQIVVAPIVSAPVIAPPPAKAVTLNGFVTRSDGRSTIWVNDKAASAGNSLGTSAPLAVPIGEADKRIELKVGQSYDDKRGKTDPLAGGRVQVNR